MPVLSFSVKNTNSLVEPCKTDPPQPTHVTLKLHGRNLLL